MIELPETPKFEAGDTVRVTRQGPCYNREFVVWRAHGTRVMARVGMLTHSWDFTHLQLVARCAEKLAVWDLEIQLYRLNPHYFGDAPGYKTLEIGDAVVAIDREGVHALGYHTELSPETWSERLVRLARGMAATKAQQEKAAAALQEALVAADQARDLLAKAREAAYQAEHEYTNASQFSTVLRDSGDSYE
jgi:hypothetical protein